MKSIIEEIYYGNRGHLEAIDFGKAYWEAQSKCCDLLENLKQSLNNKQKKLLNKICWTSAEQEAEAIRAFYSEGFKIGFNIAVECMSEYSSR